MAKKYFAISDKFSIFAKYYEYYISYRIQLRRHFGGGTA